MRQADLNNINLTIRKENYCTVGRRRGQINADDLVPHFIEPHQRDLNWRANINGFTANL